MKLCHRGLFALGLLVLGPPCVAQEGQACVVLLHGLARSASSLGDIEHALLAQGYRVSNVDYPSREQPIEALAPRAIDRGVAACRDADTVHVVTHSLGGILLRYYLQGQQIEALGRVVMLAPPNQGSQVVDRWKGVPGYYWLNGPAGMQLGTDAASVPRRLGPVEFELGVIAGTQTFNPFLSLSLPNPDDGKVSVASTRVAGMVDHIEVAHTHTFMMRADDVITQTLHFLAHGEFERDAQGEPVLPNNHVYFVYRFWVVSCLALVLIIMVVLAYRRTRRVGKVNSQEHSAG